MTHELKIWPQYYARVKDGSKTFEVRENDRGFQPGDEVELREFDPTYDDTYDNGVQLVEKIGKYTSSPILKFKIGYVFPIENNKVVFSLLKLGE